MSDNLERLKSALADRYRVERELGQGGMATVYLAEDLKHGRQVAIKVMRPEIAAALGAERFLREIEIAARLQHPHILMLIDSGEADGQLYYVMPYVEGETLESRLERETQLPIEDALQITREVASALGYAHEHGVIHRDIKPDNIMLTGGHAVVMDFGIGRAVSEAGGEKLTSTGMSVGTPAYMSPEQAGGEQGVDGRSDIYALGAVLYQMLTGEPPYTGATAQAIIVKSLSDPVPSARRIRQTVSPPLDAAISRALAKVAVDRFQTAAEFAEATSLQAIAAEGLPEWAEKSAPQRSAAAAVREIGGPRMAIAALVALVVVSVAVFAGISAVRSGEQAAGAGDGAAAVAADRIKIAVLPFENLGDPEDAYFADGMTAEISDRLARVSGLSVIARRSAARFADTAMTAGEIGTQLGAAYLLSGTVRWAKAADGSSRVRVSPQLVRVSDDTRIWGEPLDVELSDVFELQAGIAERAAQAMNIALIAADEEKIRETPTDNLAAWQEYNIGRSYFGRLEGDSAILHFERAIELDPGFALAHAGLADAYTFAIPPSAGGMLTQRMDDWRRAEEAAQRALALDSTLGPAHISLAIIRMHRDLDWDGAEAGFKRGLALAPDYAQGHDRYRSLLLATGRSDSAVAEARRAVALDPFSPFYLTNLGSSLLVAGYPEEALEVLDRMVAIDPTYRFGRDDRAVTFAILGDWDATAEELKLLGVPPAVAELYRAALVDRANNSAFLSFLDQNPAFAASAPAQVAHMLAFIGEDERAVDLLEQAVDDRVINALVTMKSWPTFASLQDNPRYQSLLRQSGLAD